MQIHKYNFGQICRDTYIFEKVMVRGPQKQCSRVSDMQTRKYNFTNTQIHWIKGDALKVKPRRPSLTSFSMKNAESALFTLSSFLWTLSLICFFKPDKADSIFFFPVDWACARASGDNCQWGQLPRGRPVLRRKPAHYKQQNCEFMLKSIFIAYGTYILVVLASWYIYLYFCDSHIQTKNRRSLWI